MLSNSDPKVVDEKDNFFLTNYIQALILKELMQREL